MEYCFEYIHLYQGLMSNTFRFIKLNLQQEFLALPLVAYLLHVLFVTFLFA